MLSIVDKGHIARLKLTLDQALTQFNRSLNLRALSGSGFRVHFGVTLQTTFVEVLWSGMKTFLIHPLSLEFAAPATAGDTDGYEDFIDDAN